MPEPGTSGVDGRITVVVRTHGDAAVPAQCLERLAALPERPAIVVVDATACNAGVARVRTPFVAFCDDDAWWAPGALGRAADVLQAHASLGALAARVLVGPDNRADARCEPMAASALPRGDGPGPALIDFAAGAVVMRTAAFRQAGGCEPRLDDDAAQALLALDLVSAGWRIAYVREVVLHRHPAAVPEPPAQRLARLRSRIWLAWLRLSPALAWHTTRTALREAGPPHRVGGVLLQALRVMAWVVARRRVAPREVQAAFARVHGGPVPRPAARRPDRSPSGTGRGPRQPAGAGPVPRRTA